MFDIKEQVLRDNYGEMLEAMKQEATKFYTNFKDSPDNLSEWGHNYFCAEDGERLIFDLDKPNEHECKLCHKVYKTQTFDNVWTYFYRNEAILTIMKLAVLYKMEKKQEYLDEYKKILGFYSDNYTQFTLHAKDKILDVKDLTYDVGGAARLMPQGLNEAIVIIRIIISFEILKEDLDQEFIDGVVNNLFKNAVAVLKPQIIRIHNIPCWLNSAVGAIALFTQDQELIDFVFDSEFGINNQLEQGVTEDKFWYEGSTHYNFFLLEGVVYLLSFCKLYGKEMRNQKIVEDMLIQAYHYSFDNDRLPNPNDAW
ncbi:MAG: heparinase II/III family protein, partial [bacterium]